MRVSAKRLLSAFLSTCMIVGNFSGCFSTAYASSANENRTFVSDDPEIQVSEDGMITFSSQNPNDTSNETSEDVLSAEEMCRTASEYDDIDLVWNPDETVKSGKVKVVFNYLHDAQLEEYTTLEDMIDPKYDDKFHIERSEKSVDVYDLSKENGMYAFCVNGIAEHDVPAKHSLLEERMEDGRIFFHSTTSYYNYLKADGIVLIPYEKMHKGSEYIFHAIQPDETVIPYGQKTGIRFFQKLLNSFSTGEQTAQTKASAASTGVVGHTYAVSGSGSIIKWKGSFNNPWENATVGGANRNVLTYNLDGIRAFCLEPGVSLHTEDKLDTTAGSQKWNKFSADQQFMIQAIIVNFNDLNESESPTGDELWMAAQALIWEVACWNDSKLYRNPATFSRTSSTIYSNYLGNSSKAQSYYTTLVSEINTYLTEHNPTNTSFSGTKLYGAPNLQLIAIPKTTQHHEDGNLNVKVTKTSSAAIVGNASMYSLDGARYIVYTGSCTNLSDAKTNYWKNKKKLGDYETVSGTFTAKPNMTLTKGSQKYILIRETYPSKGYRKDLTLYLVYVTYDAAADKVAYEIWKAPYTSKTNLDANSTVTWSSVKSSTSISATSSIPVSVKETPKTIHITTTKSMTNAAYVTSAYSVEGAEYTVWYNDTKTSMKDGWNNKTLIGTYVTNSSGKIALPEGQFHK